MRVRILSRAGAPNRGFAAAVVVACALYGHFAQAEDTGTAGAAPSAGRGAYILAAAGCAECHTDKKNNGPFLSGGRALATPFGIFYSPNITPDPATGIGKWSEADFRRAIRSGVGPKGAHFYPVFPYPSFTFMTDPDIADLFAYLKTVPAVTRPNVPHKVGFPYNVRVLMVVWNWLYLKRGPYEPNPEKSAEWNRGAYLVQALGHCGECHTPRTRLGALDREMTLAGTDDGPDGDHVPNLTPDKETGIGKWALEDITFALQTGLTPGGDSLGASMGGVVNESTSKLSPEDRMAIAIYLRSLPPIQHRVSKSKPKS
ncbi:MAG TPA: cytochrome c [Alphaproteobacteria bacterium]|nr:cytochrome c [Alphaproteobacteria bacterium]